MKSKKILTILLSLAIMFTFMPAMAFADDYAPTELPPSSDGVVTAIDWAADYHSANVTIEDKGTWSFEYFDTFKPVEAKKSDVTKNITKFVVAPVANSYSGGSVTYGLFTAHAVDTRNVSGAEYDYTWTLDSDDFATTYDVDYSGKGTGKEKFMTREVYDASYIAAVEMANHAATDGAIVADAGDYASWYAQKDLADKYRWNDTVTAFNNKDGLETVGGFSSDFLNVTYPAYSAYEYDTNAAGKKVDKTLAIGVTLNEDAIKAEDDEAIFSTATGSVPLVAKITDVSNSFFTYNRIYGLSDDAVTDAQGKLTSFSYNREIGWYINDNSAYNTNFPATYDNNITYDGASHKFVWLQEPKSVTAKYYVVKADKNGKFADAKDSDWVTTFPETIKDAGEYLVAVRLISEKNDTIVYNKSNKVSELNYEVVTVSPKSVGITFKQDVLKVEYGKYNATAIEEAIKNMVVVADAPDSADKIAEAIQKYATVTGLFEDAGANTVNVKINEKGLADDADLSAALANYKLTPGDGLRLVIEKADNDVNLKAVTKSFKAKKKTKKLAKKKTFKLSATADHGSVLFKKTSGNAKITVSSAGKVTVKKGLKKGTYNVKVKAYTKGTANYAAGSDTQTIVVKIK